MPEMRGADGRGAVLCVSCGYDFRTKSKAKTAKAPAIGYEAKPAKGNAANAGAGEERAPAEGNFFMGLAFGALFALGGAIVYGVLNYFIGDVPFLGRLAAWSVLGVGYLAGLGVDKGYKGGNVVAGITAAGVTLVVVVITKFVILASIVVPIVKKSVADAATDRDDERVASMVRDEAMKKDGLSPHSAGDDEMEKYQDAADKRVEKMTDAQYQSYEKKADAYEERDLLFEPIRNEMLRQKGIDPVKMTHPQEIVAAKEAEAKIDGMSDSEVHQKLKAADAQAAQELKERMASASQKHNSSSGDEDKSDTGISGSVIGFGIVLGFIFLLWLMLPTIIAMAVAYKVAANA